MPREKVRTTFLTAITDGAVKREGYRLIVGYKLPTNESGWFAYRNRVDARWYIIEGYSGFAVGHGPTMLSALDDFLSNEVKLMTWCAKAGNLRPICDFPIVETKNA